MDPRRWLGWTIRCAGLLILPLLIWAGVDLGSTIEVIRGADGSLVLVAVALTVASVLLRVWRWRIVARACGLPYVRYVEYLRLHLTGLFAGTAAPQLAALFVPALFVAREGGSWRRAALSIFLDRSVEMALLLGFAVWGAVYLFPQFPSVSLAVFAAAGAVCVGGVGALTLGYRGRLHVGSHDLWRPIQRVFRFAAFEQWVPAAKALGGSLVPLAVVSLAVLALQVSVVVSLAGALDLSVPLVFLVATYSLVLLVTSLPISVLGLGPREGVLVAVLAASSVTREEALALGVLLTAVVLATRLPGVVPWFWHRRASAPAGTLADDLRLVGGD